MKCFLRISLSIVVMLTSLSISTKPLSFVAEDLTAYSEVWNLIKIYRPNYVELDPNHIQQKLIHKNILYAKMEILRSTNDINSAQNGRIIASIYPTACDADHSDPDVVDCPSEAEYQASADGLYNASQFSQQRGEYLVNKKNDGLSRNHPALNNSQPDASAAAILAPYEANVKSGLLVKREFNGRTYYCESASIRDGDTSTCFDPLQGQSNAKSTDSNEHENSTGSDVVVKSRIADAAKSMRAEVQKCEAEKQNVLTFCGSNQQAADQSRVRSMLETSNRDLFLNLAAQISRIRNANGDMKTQCEAARNINVTVAAVNGAYAKICDVYRAKCESICGTVAAQNQEYANNGLTDENVKGYTLEIAKMQATAHNSREECGSAAANGLNANINNAMQAATMAAQQAQQCATMLSATSACQNPSDIARPECQSFCSQSANMRSPFCISASRNCADPAIAATQPACRCMINPQSPGCGGGRSVAGIPDGGSAPLPRGGSGSFNGDSSGFGQSQMGNVNFGTDGSAAAQGKAGSAGGLARFQESGGGGARGGSGGGQGLEANKGGGSGGQPYNPNILNGFYEGGGGRKVAAVGQSMMGTNGKLYSPQMLAKMSSEEKRRLNLRAFLPKDGSYQLSGRVSMAGAARLSEDGVTGPLGPTLFEKVSRRYRVKSAMLLQ